MSDLKSLIEERSKARVDLDNGVQDLLETLRANSDYVANNGGGDTGSVAEQTKRLLRDSQAEVMASEVKKKLLSRFYEPSPDTLETVENASVLGKPLLVEGPPGGGKTALAYWLTVEFDADLIVFSGKRDVDPNSLLYRIDNVSRFRDLMEGNEVPEALRIKADEYLGKINAGIRLDENAEFANFMKSWDAAEKMSGKPERVRDIGNYIVYGELGEAIMRTARGEKVVLLFDEVDKTGNGFEDNLLREIDELTISIRETGMNVSGVREKLKIIFTSNRTRVMSEAFKRRCVYTYMEFPKRDQIERIVRGNFENISENLLSSALDAFYRLRVDDRLHRQPSTAELLDWLKILVKSGIDRVPLGTIPYPGVLVKEQEDLDQIKKNVEQENENIPVFLREALSGRRVVRLGWDGDVGYADIVKLLAQKKIKVDYPGDFDIHHPGVTKLDDKETFSFTQEGEEVLKLLQESGASLTELIELEGEPEIGGVVSSNKDFALYKSPDGNNQLFSVGGKFFTFVGGGDGQELLSPAALQKLRSGDLVGSLNGQ